MNNSFQIAIYRDSMLKITCGVHLQHVIKAKPILLIALISAIEKGIIRDNRITHDEEFVKLYKQVHNDYGEKVTPFFKPYYYMQYEDFWHLKWKGQEDLSIRPSMSMLKDYIDYAYLDNALWDLWQDIAIRDNFRSIIENNYLK